MLLKNQLIEQKHSLMIFQFHFRCQVICKNVLITNTKQQLLYCPDGLMVELSVSNLHA